MGRSSYGLEVEGFAGVWSGVIGQDRCIDWSAAVYPTCKLSRSFFRLSLCSLASIPYDCSARSFLIDSSRWYMKC